MKMRINKKRIRAISERTSGRLFWNLNRTSHDYSSCSLPNLEGILNERMAWRD